MILRYFVGLVGALLLMVPGTVFAEIIQSYDVYATINTDSSIDIVETIQYDFGLLEKHGIYRTIPTSIKTEYGNNRIVIKNISVLDNTGNKYKFVVSGADPIEIKIGHPDKTITGLHTYVISYTVKNSLGFGESSDEFYWNMIGTDWSIPIKYSDIKVNLPEGVFASDVKAQCYQGKYGSTQPCTSLSLNDGTRTSLEYTIVGGLAAREGATVKIEMPKHMVTEPSSLQKFLWFLYGNIHALISLLIPFVLFGYIYSKWRKVGKDPKGRETIIPRYTPPEDLSPLEAGAIRDERVDHEDFVAEIIYLAQRGHLKIRQLENKVLGIFSSTDYEIERTRAHEEDLLPFQEEIILGLFSPSKENTIKLSSKKGKMSGTLNLVSQLAQESLTSKGYYKADPRKVRNKYMSVGVLLFAAGFPIVGISGSIYYIFGLIIPGFILIYISSIMPAKTLQGVYVKEHMLGLKEYINTAEKDRIAFHNAPKKDPELFETLLPYAIILRLEKEWAKEFEGISMEDPKWYTSASSTRFSPVVFVQDMRGFSTAMTAASSSSGSGGGGFSGGGGGGGGGGSW